MAVQDALRVYLPESEVLTSDGHDWVADPFSKGTWFAPPPGWETGDARRADRSGGAVGVRRWRHRVARRRVDRGSGRQRPRGGASGAGVRRMTATANAPRHPARAETVGSLLRPPRLRAAIDAFYEPGHSATLAEERDRDRSELTAGRGRGDPYGGAAADRLRPRRRHRRRVPAMDVHELVLRRGRRRADRQDRRVPQRPRRGRTAEHPRDRGSSGPGRLAGRARGSVHGRRRPGVSVQGDVPGSVDLRTSADDGGRPRGRWLRLARGVRRARDRDRARAGGGRDRCGRAIHPVRFPAVSVPGRSRVDRALRRGRARRERVSSMRRSRPTSRCWRASPMA